MKKRIGSFFTAAILSVSVIFGNCMPVSAYDENDRHKYPTDAYLQGIIFDGKKDMTKYIDNTAQFYSKNNINMMWTWYDTGQDALERMQLTKMFISFTHGNQGGISLRDSKNQETWLTVDMIKNLEKNKLNSLQLCFYCACQTGRGGSSGKNMVNAAADRGAQVVIGFKEDVVIKHGNQYLYDFTKSLLQEKKTYKQSMADGLFWAKFWFFGLAGGMDSAYTRGDLNQTYKQYK